jgi:hypothetical protein
MTEKVGIFYEAYFLGDKEKKIHNELRKVYYVMPKDFFTEDVYEFKDSLVIGQSNPEKNHLPIFIIGDKEEKTKSKLERELKCVLKEIEYKGN